MIELLDGMELVGEGNISMFPDRVNLLTRLLTQYKPQYILEIGFCLGHSMKHIIDTLLSLENYEGIKKIYVFDICEGDNENGHGGKHSYVKPNFEILKNHYNIDIELIEGDSLVTVKPFLDKIDHELDFIEIDGLHEDHYPKKDVDNTIGKLKKGGVMYLDDYNNQYSAVVDAVKNTDWSNFDTYSESEIFYAIKK